MTGSAVKIVDFIFAARPMLLFPVWSIYLISYKLLSPDPVLDYAGLLPPAGLTLVFCGTYYINQIYDYESDRINRKLGFLQKNMITRSEMTAAYISTSVLAVLLAFYSGLAVGILICLIFLLGFIYSAPPARLKDRPLAGLLSNICAYGVLIPAVAAPGVYSRMMIHVILYFALLVGAGYLLTIMPDREGDRKTGKKTLAAYFSDRVIIFMALLLLIAGFYFALRIDNLFLIGICAVSAGLFTAALVWPKGSLVLFSCKFPIFLVSLLAGYYFPVYLVFILVLLILTRLYYKKRFGMIYPRIN